MYINVSSEAWERLKQIWPKEKILRINGEIVGGCGMNIEYSLFWDEPAPHDVSVPIEARAIHIDPETIGYLETPSLMLDYRENQGFKLISPAQTVAYAMRITDRWR